MSCSPPSPLAIHSGARAPGFEPDSTTSQVCDLEQTTQLLRTFFLTCKMEKITVPTSLSVIMGRNEAIHVNYFAHSNKHLIHVSNCNPLHLLLSC